jgi:hypothetical protein
LRAAALAASPFSGRRFAEPLGSAVPKLSRWMSFDQETARIPAFIPIVLARVGAIIE